MSKTELPEVAINFDHSENKLGDAAHGAVSNIMDEVNTIRSNKPQPAENNVADAINSTAQRDAIGEKAEGDKAFLKKIGAVEERPLPLLDRTEKKLTGNLANALESGNAKLATAALQDIAQQSPESAARIMQHVQRGLHERNAFNQASFSQTTDAQGNQTVRLDVNQLGKLGEGIRMSISSNGERSASYTPLEGKTVPVPMDYALGRVTAATRWNFKK
jgi:hypothetical protein